jgi:hypothetical protein
MKRIFALVAVTITTQALFAKTIENFNSRAATGLGSLKGYLQDRCWQFPDFAINRAGWNPGIEGDGAMVSGPGSDPKENTGIYSQPLSIAGEFSISFKYAFNNAVTDRRWMKISLLDGDGNRVTLLDSTELTGASANIVYTYTKTFSAGSGSYKVYINYQGIGGTTRIAIDQLQFNVPASYIGGCNQAPVAVDDDFNGNGARFANGNILQNDYDPEKGVLTARLIANSPDGNIILEKGGNFSFTPNPGFTGKSTRFTYIVSDNGSPALCSRLATATIHFPEQAPLPGIITDLSATYNRNKVLLRWATAFEPGNDYFDIERSTDGANFKTMGRLPAQGDSASRHDYLFEDEVKQAKAAKNDFYYRLKQVDAGGKVSYSKVLVVRVYQTRSLQSVSITPNPSVNDIRVNVDLNENAYIVMKVTGNNGTELMRRSGRGNTGMNSFTFNGTSALQQGVYFLELIVNSNERMTVKLVKS